MAGHRSAAYWIVHLDGLKAYASRILGAERERQERQQKSKPGPCTNGPSEGEHGYGMSRWRRIWYHVWCLLGSMEFNTRAASGGLCPLCVLMYISAHARCGLDVQQGIGNGGIRGVVHWHD